MNILGIGSLANENAVAMSQKVNYLSSDLNDIYAWCQDVGIIAKPIKNFGRFDALSKMTCLTVALSLYDAGMFSESEQIAGASLVGVTSDGSFDSNVRYFRDYVESGRTLARGNYFTYTLSTSSLSQASIAFGLCGAVVSFMSLEGSVLRPLLETHVMNSLSRIVVVVVNDESGMCACVLSDKSEISKNIICTDDALYRSIDAARDVSGVVASLTTIGS